MSENGAAQRTNGRGRSPAARPTDDELLDAARAVFADRGFAQATMEAIAERANSTKPTLYAHFGDKVALYQAAFTREATALGEWLVTVYDAGADQPVPEQVRGYVMALFRYATVQPDGFRLLFEGSPEDEMSPARQGMVDLITRFVAKRVRSYLRQVGREPGPSAELLAAMMVGLVSSAAHLTLKVEGLDPIAAGELATSFIQASVRHLTPEALAALDAIDGRSEPSV
ncbi:MAG TPA: TetR/AcrR family transcriptional regulator [Pseudonocardiaceae bacterium]|jgi:AcrR family transcriptional regulator|nr:TetR/AcrR family transcriptional regulator [Pseudonocardiaceae bacterium]